MPDTPPVLRCSFCNKSQRDVRKLIAGPNVYICDECVDICLDIIAEDAGTVSDVRTASASELITIEEIESRLHKAVVGQYNAVRSLAAIVHNQLRRANSVYSEAPVHEVPNKVNCLVLGPRGSGKTTAVRALAKAVDLPFVAIDAAAFGGARYMRFEEPIQLLARRATEMSTTLTFGILFVDNVDIITTKSERRAQQILLPILTGNVILDEKSSYDTRNVLVIFGGHFPSIEEKLAARKDNPASTSLDPNLLIEAGLVPELATHFGTVCRFEPPSADDLNTMLTMPERGIFASYTALFANDGVELRLIEDAAKTIVQEALRRKTGARALRGIVENIIIAVSSEMAKQKGVKVFEIDGSLVSRVLW